MKRNVRKILAQLPVILGFMMVAVSFSQSAAPDQKVPLHPKPEQVPAGAVLPQAKALPDLMIANIEFSVVQETTWGTGHPCKIFNLVPTVSNIGNTPAGPFTVIIERNKGAGGAFELACPACAYSLPGLAKGESRTLEPRQFNNCTSEDWNTFRVTADPARAVNELNENNNTMTRFFPQDRPGQRPRP